MVSEYLNFTNQNERFYKRDARTAELEAKLNIAVDNINKERAEKRKAGILLTNTDVPYVRLLIAANGPVNAYSLSDGTIVLNQALINILILRMKLWLFYSMSYLILKIIL